MNRIKNYYSQVVNALVAAKNNGFFHIFISSTLVKIVSFISAMFLPRIITDKADYGLLVYVDNISAYIMLINGIGIAHATLRYCVNTEDEKKKKGYFLITILIGIIFDIVLIILSICMFLLIPFEFDGAKNLLLLLSILPLFMFLFEDIQLFLRACFENKKYSLLSFFYTGMMLIGQIGFAFYWGLEGVVIGRYLAVMIAIGIGFTFLHKIKTLKVKAIFPNKSEIITMLKFGIVMLLGNSISYVMQLNETFILAYVLKDKTLLADYKIASYILVISTFVVQSIAIFIFPYFTKNMNNKVLVWQHFKKLFIINLAIMVPIHILLFIFSPFFILIVFGEQYINAAPIMQMLLVASLGQTTLRVLTGNVLSATGEEKFNLKINVVFMLMHIVIDIWAVTKFGIYGAAIALTAVYYISGAIMIVYLRYVCLKKARKLTF